MNDGVSAEPERSEVHQGVCLLSERECDFGEVSGSVCEMFETVLSGWAFDWLGLLARGLDQPLCVGRVIAAEAEIIAGEMSEDEGSGDCGELGCSRLFSDEVYGGDVFRRISP